MSESSDASLLGDYVSKWDEDAFAELVRRHLPMVYSAAARVLGNEPSAAEDVAQIVFVQLAQRGGELIGHPVLAGWLYVTATRKAADHYRQLIRRQRRESMHPNTPTPETAEPCWSEIRPILDSALMDLAGDDRDALILRYFDENDFASVGRALGLSADAARMRVTRGSERLRILLKKKGITSSALALEALLLREAVEAVPSGLAGSIARAVRTSPTPQVASPALETAVAKVLSTVALLLLVTAVGTGAFRLWRSSQSARRAGLGEPGPGRKELASGNAAGFLRGRARTRPRGTPADPKLTLALGYLRSALFDIGLGRPERRRLIEQSAQMLVGWEGESIPLFREALSSADPEVLIMAVEGLGRFGSLPREFGPELLTLLEDPRLTDEAGLIANRLLPAILLVESPVNTLLSLLERRPDLGSSIQYLLTAVIGSEKSLLAANREMVEALLQHPNQEIQEAAAAILAAVPPSPPQPTPEVSGRLTTLLGSADEGERLKALVETMHFQAITPEIRQALTAMLEQDPSLPLRIDARIELARLDPNNPALAIAPAAEREKATAELLSSFDRHEASLGEMLTAIADRSVDPGAILGRLPAIDPVYWAAHPDEKLLTTTVLISLHRDRDARVYEAVTDAYAQLNQVPRATYSLDQLAPYFATMESALTPGEYGVAMRDLKSSLASYWQARGFIQSEPSHLPADLVQILLVGPLHENRQAYDQMLRVIREIDPSFRPPLP